MDKLGFFREFARSPIRTGALCASSKRLADVMTEAVDLPSAKVVVEMGPGTGIVTEQILSGISPGTRFFALEINPAFAEATRRRCPGADVRVDDARNARKHLEDLGVEHCDAVLSGLPWASFAPAKQDALLEAIRGILRPGGRFVTFAYLQGLLLPPAHRFERKLIREFGRVKKTPTVWRNIPPAFAWVAVR
jgi:phospholipid N-methyltransferase